MTDQSLNVDSVFSNKFANANNISIETVADLEEQFDFDEMVSLVFLLYDDPETALCRLAVAQISGSNIGLLKNWVLSVQNKIEHWRITFLEALCITQCYAVLRKLGFNKIEMNERFLPFNEYTSLHVNLVRKALYRLCENLTDIQSKLFLSYIKEDFLTNPRIQFEDYHGLYLEMYMLHWSTLKYITLSEKDPVNVDKILKVLKVIEMEDLKDVLSSVVDSFNKSLISKNMNDNHRNTESLKKNNTLKLNINEVYSNDLTSVYPKNELQFEKNVESLRLTDSKNMSGNFSQHDALSDTSENISLSTSYSRDQLYYIDKNHVGVCIIINQKTFEKNPDPIFQNSLAAYTLAEREGTDVDAENLKTTWSDLGFTVVCYKNVPHYEIISSITKTIKKEFTVNHGCLVICILSHGDVDVIYGSDSVSLPVSEIENSLYDLELNLLGKPKILIIQACQGTPRQKAVSINRSAMSVRRNDSELTTDGPSKETISYDTVPEFADLLVCWSTVPGFASVRHTKLGTWFINSFCEILRQDARNKHFMDIVSTVTARVSNKRWNDEWCMVPLWKGTFTKILYFPSSAHSL